MVEMSRKYDGEVEELKKYIYKQKSKVKICDTVNHVIFIIFCSIAIGVAYPLLFCSVLFEQPSDLKAWQIWLGIIMFIIIVLAIIANKAWLWNNDKIKYFSKRLFNLLAQNQLNILDYGFDILSNDDIIKKCIEYEYIIISTCNKGEFELKVKIKYSPQMKVFVGDVKEMLDILYF